MEIAYNPHHPRWLPLLLILASPAVCSLPAAPGPSSVAAAPRENFYDGRHNGLANIPQDVPLNTKTLYLSYNDLTSLADRSFSHLKSLSHLDAAFNALTKVSPKAFLETRLSSLDLCWNKISTFPDLRAAHGTLEYLDICRNQLEAIPSWAFQGLRLKSLDLSYNRISVFPDLSLIVDTLSVLDLSNNPITSVPANGLSGLLSLERLYMENCKLTSFPDFHLLPSPNSLREIHLSRNQIATFRSDSSRTLTSVTELFLGYNHLSSVPPDGLLGLNSLDSLDLSQNRFTALPNLLAVNRTLSFLDFSNNDLSQVDGDWLPQLVQSLSKLDYLVLKNTRLRLAADIRPFTGSRDLHLDMSGNTDLVCDCRLSWLKVSGLAKDLTADSKVCGEPASLRPRRWEDITQEMLCQGPNIDVQLSPQPAVQEPYRVENVDFVVDNKDDDDDDSETNNEEAFVNVATAILNKEADWTELSDHVTVVALVAAGIFLWLAIAVYVCVTVRRRKSTSVIKSPTMVTEPPGAAQFVYKNESSLLTPVEKLVHDT